MKASPTVTLQKRKLAEAVLTEVQGQEALDYKELGYTVPWEHQDRVAQEVHVGQEQHHEAHEEQVDPMDLLDPVIRVTHRWNKRWSSPFFSSLEDKSEHFKKVI